MLPQMLSGRPLNDQTVETLRRLTNKLLEIQQNHALWDAYLGWAAEAMTALRMVFSEGEIRRLVMTDGFRVISTSGRSIGSSGVVMAEVDARRAQWTQLVDDVEKWRSRWPRGSTIVVADTNVYVHYADSFDAIDWRGLIGARSDQAIRVVVPMVVLDELDDLKRHFKRGAPKVRVRHTVREFQRRFEDPHKRSILVKASTPTGETTIELFWDAIDHVRLPRPDDEIADRTRFLEDVTERPMFLVTNDNGMAIRAGLLDLRVIRVDFSSDSD